MLNQGDNDKDFDEEIERTLTGEQTHPIFGDSDEEVSDLYYTFLLIVIDIWHSMTKPVLNHANYMCT